MKKRTSQIVRAQFILSIITAVLSINLLAGCAKNETRDFPENMSTNQESTDKSEEISTEIKISSRETQITSIDSENLSSIVSSDRIESSTDTKQAVIDQLKKLAEENAEKDRYNIIEALGDAESDERCSAANQFIKEHYPDFFSSEELLQRSIEYGHYLASLYKDSEGPDNGGGRYYEMGKLVSEVAQNVYLGINKCKDEMVVEKLQKLEEHLIFFYDKYYGNSSEVGI